MTWAAQPNAPPKRRPRSKKAAKPTPRPPLPLLRDQQGHRSARRPGHAHRPLHRGSRQVHHRQQRPSVLPLPAAHRRPCPAPSRRGVQGQVRQWHVWRLGRGSGLERRSRARHAARAQARRTHPGAVHQRQRSLAHAGRRMAASPGRCTAARARPGKAACANPRSRGGPAKFPPTAPATPR